MNNLQDTLLELVNKDDYSKESLLTVLDPISKFINNPVFISHLGNIITVIAEDRNGDSKFSIEDLKLISNDSLALSTIINGLFLIVIAANNTSIKYDSGATTTLIFNLLTYIFLVVVPNETSNKLTVEDRKSIITLLFQIYDLLQSTSLINEGYNKVSKWFEYKGWCKCLCNTNSKYEVFDTHIEDIKTDIRSSVLKNKEINILNDRIKTLESNEYTNVVELSIKPVA